MLVVLLAAALFGKCHCKFVETPNGLWAEECVHQVPSGLTHIYPNGTEKEIGKCTVAPRQVRPGIRRGVLPGQAGVLANALANSTDLSGMQP